MCVLIRTCQCLPSPHGSVFTAWFPAGSMTNWKTLREAKELDTSEKAQYYTAKATILMCKKDNCMYQVRPSVRPRCSQEHW